MKAYDFVAESSAFVSLAYDSVREEEGYVAFTGASETLTGACVTEAEDFVTDAGQTVRQEIETGAEGVCPLKHEEEAGKDACLGLFFYGD